MSTLREKIEALPNGRGGGWEIVGLVEKSEVLRIVAEHEREMAPASLALAEVSSLPNPHPLSHAEMFALATETNADSH